MQANESKYWQEGVDSKALLVTFLQKMPYLLLLGVAGAFLGSGLYLLIAVMTSEGTIYQAKTEYYIDFADGRLEARDYYNDFTWNHVMATSLILENTMEQLGDLYEREVVKGMITADILSDVRYLTITVTGSNPDMVKQISDATITSLELFGQQKEEFDSIDLIEDNQVKQVTEPLFTWRASLLGVMVGLGIGILWIICDFCIGSRYYTKRSVSESLGIPVLGLLYKNGNEAQGKQEKGLQLALQYRLEKAEKKPVILMDILEGGFADKCKNTLIQLYSDEQIGAVLLEQSSAIDKKEDFERIRQAQGAILVIPFGKSCRESAVDMLQQLKNQECNVLGAILVDVDKRWMKMYGIH